MISFGTGQAPTNEFGLRHPLTVCASCVSTNAQNCLATVSALNKALRETVNKPGVSHHFSEFAVADAIRTARSGGSLNGENGCFWKWPADCIGWPLSISDKES
jgi:hypothetical protein